MNKNDTYYFLQLKKAVASTFLKRHGAPESIKDWNGETIVLFQEDLFEKVKTKVSEKWFYTYFKNESEKLPRIDMLNLLASYVGFENWYAFKTSLETPKKKKSVRKRYLFLLFPFIVFAILYFGMDKENEFRFCFVDATRNTPIINEPLDIKIIKDHESPIYFKTDSSGCFTFKTKQDYLKFVVQSPFYKTDTIVRYIDSNINRTVKLSSDDYALMLHYYSNGNVKDWEKHKSQLNALIADHAKIYQLFDGNMGIEVYSKAEFIRLLTIPTQRLKHVKILNKTIRNGKIVKLKFIIK